MIRRLEILLSLLKIFFILLKTDFFSSRYRHTTKNNLAVETARSHWLVAGKSNISFSRVILPLSPRGIQGGTLFSLNYSFFIYYL